MVLSDGQTGKRCCQDNSRGQHSVHELVLNKVPINNSFISDRNQCSDDSVNQLTPLTAHS